MGKSGLFCQEKHDKDLTVTFIDSEGNDFDCRVLVPAEMYKPNKDGSPKSRELLVGLSLMGQKRKRLELPETDRVVTCFDGIEMSGWWKTWW